MPIDNGYKKLLTRLLIWTLGIIIVLASVIWGITWATTKSTVRENSKCNNVQNERIAKLEKGYDNIEKRLDQIYDEVRDK